MPKTYHIHPSAVYYLDPTSPTGLRAEIEPGRCSIYHDYVAQGEFLRASAHVEYCDENCATHGKCKKGQDKSTLATECISE